MLTNENEFRVTRSRTKGAENIAPSHPKLVHLDTLPGRNGSVSASNASKESLVERGRDSQPASLKGSAAAVADTAGGANGRPHLRDVSRQFGIAKTGPLQPPKKRQLGSSGTKLGGGSSVSGPVGGSISGSDSENVDMENIEPEDQKASSKVSSKKAISVNNARAPLEPIQHRLPQKRQASESSYNLVEKLHPANNHNHTHSHDTRGASGADIINSDLTHGKYKKSKKTEYEWQDLDEEDFDDPLMVSEYVNDIFPYLHELEKKTLPDAGYLLKQTNMKPRMRSILVDWLVEMHQRFRLLPETLFLAINIMDRFMSVEVVQIDKLQLLATGLLFIAAKYEEVFSPSVKNYAYFTDGSYTEEEILEAEKYILTILNFDMSYPNPMNFLRRISKADDYDVQLRTLGKFLLEVTIVDHKFIGQLPSLCSAAAMYIARLILRKDPVWNGNLIHYSGGYRVEDMKECVELLFNYLIGPIEHDEFYKKYSSRKFMKASVVCRSWAKKFVNERKDLFDPAVLTTTIPS